MAFQYDGKDVGVALGQGVDNKKTRQEAPVTFGYESGTPIRFAGAELRRNIGMNGEFGTQTQDKKSKSYFRDWTSFWTQGPFSPGLPDDGGVA